MVADYLFITGILAADSLELVLERMNPEFTYRVEVLNISVAALMNTEWIARHLPADAYGCSQIIIPGSCKGNLTEIEDKTEVRAARGPKDLKDVPVFFGGEQDREGYGEYHTKILAEITEAYQMSEERILAEADYYHRNGADIIDLGCPAQGGFHGVERVVRLLKDRGHIVSLDSFDPETILRADRAGIDFLLSINAQNIDLAPKLKCKVVVIPDFGKGLDSLEKNASRLEKSGVSYIMDPILDPIGFGFSESLHRFYELRQRHPKAEILMGMGNLTELTDADSSGINAVMAGIIAELRIDYVLTTEVISWAKGAVRELDIARRLMFYAQKNHVLPKRLDDRLITAKDPPFERYGESELRGMHKKLRDHNYRIFIDDSCLFVFNHNCFIRGRRPDEILQHLEPVDADQAFYLGRELERAFLALRLKKRYSQDTDLRWGYLSENWEEGG